MNQARLVGFGQRIAGLSQQVNHSRRSQRSVLFDQICQTQAWQIFHHVIERAIFGPTVIEDFHRVPMRQLGGGPHFTLEACECPGIRGLGGSNDFDGAGAFHHLMFGQIHFAHAAGADQLAELVLAQSFRLECFAAQVIDGVRPVQAGAVSQA